MGTGSDSAGPMIGGGDSRGAGGVRGVLACVLLATAAGGCSFAADTLWPTLTGTSPRGAGQRVEIPATAAERAGQPLASGPAPVVRPAAPVFPVGPPPVAPVTATPQTVLAPSPARTVAQVAPGMPPVQGIAFSSGTVVGQKVAQTRDEVSRLNASVGQRTAELLQLRAGAVQTAGRFHTLVGNINARLQVGTTPGNPILVSQWDQAQGELDRVSTEISRMNMLASQVAADASVASYLLESVRAAYSVAGALEEDHRQLAGLEDEVNRTVVGIDRLLSELSEDVNRQSAYISSERSNMIALSLAIKNGELYGGSLANRAFAPVASLGGSPPLASAGSAAPLASAATDRPLVVIRFDRPRPDYEQALYTAVSRALERRPTAAFNLVAISPTRGSAAEATLNATNARRNAETVLRSLTDMGLPPDRVSLSASSSGTAQSTEVHLFVR